MNREQKCVVVRCSEPALIDVESPCGHKGGLCWRHAREAAQAWVGARQTTDRFELLSVGHRDGVVKELAVRVPGRLEYEDLVSAFDLSYVVVPVGEHRLVFEEAMTAEKLTGRDTAGAMNHAPTNDKPEEG